MAPKLIAAKARSMLRHPRHIPAFWATIERALPDYHQRQTRLAGTGTTIWLG
jgi:predicted metal-dependent hydrolase